MYNIYVLFQIKMQKITEIKFLKVAWREAKDVKQREGEEDSIFEQKKLNKGLNNALEEMETVICQHLKMGWQLKGEVAYVKQYNTASGSWPQHVTLTHLVQTLVKYETPTDINLFVSDDLIDLSDLRV